MHAGFSKGIIFFIILSGIWAGCASNDPDSFYYTPSDTSCPPSWYTTPPKSSKYLYAVGWSGPTYRPSKSREQALTRAVARLAQQVETHIKNQMVIRQNLDRVTYSDSLTTSDINAKIKGFTIVAEVASQEGDGPMNRPGSTYILIRIPKSDL